MPLPSAMQMRTSEECGQAVSSSRGNTVLASGPMGTEACRVVPTEISGSDRAAIREIFCRKSCLVLLTNVLRTGCNRQFYGIVGEQVAIVEWGRGVVIQTFRRLGDAIRGDDGRGLVQGYLRPISTEAIAQKLKIDTEARERGARDQP